MPTVEEALLRRIALLEADRDRFRRLWLSALDRIASQSDALSRRAERAPEPDRDAVATMAWEGCPNGE